MKTPHIPYIAERLHELTADRQRYLEYAITRRKLLNDAAEDREALARDTARLEDNGMSARINLTSIDWTLSAAGRGPKSSIGLCEIADKALQEDGIWQDPSKTSGDTK